MSDIHAAKMLILADWEKRRDELDILISALRRELGMSADDSATPETTIPQTSTAPIKVEQIINPGDLFGMTQVGAAREFLSRLNKRTATLTEIASALYRGKATTVPLSDAGLKNLSSLLSRSEDFISVARGRWGLSEWYPNRAKKVRKSADQKPAEDTAEVEN